MHRSARRSLFVIVSVFVLFGASVYSQEPVSAEKKALIREFLDLTGGEKTVNEIMEAMSSFEDKTAQQMIETMLAEDKTLSPAEKEMVREAAAGSAKRIKQRTDQFLKELNIAQMFDEIAFPLYDKHFTEAELREIVAFYRTPTGQKMIGSAPKIVLDTMMAFSEKFAPKLADFMKKVAEEELAEIKKKAQESEPKRKTLKS